MDNQDNKPYYIIVFGSGSTFIDRTLKSLSQRGVRIGLPVYKRRQYYRTGPEFKRIRIFDVLKLGDLVHSFLFFLYLMFISPVRLFRFIKLVSKQSYGYKSKVVQIVKSLPLLREEPDLIHFEWLSEAIDFEWVFDFFNCPVVVSVRGRQVNILPHIPGIENHLQKLVHIMQKACAVHCVCDDIRQVAIELGMPPEKGVVIYTAVDPEFYKPVEKKAEAVSLKIIMVGALIWRKGYEYALLAIRKVIDAGIDVELSIIGSGADYDHMMFTIHDLNLEGNVHLLGELPPHLVVKQLQSSHIFLHTAVSEGIPNVIVEGMSCGLPVICTDCGGTREAVDNGVEGLLVPTRDAESIANAILLLAKDPFLRNRMGQVGRVRVLQQFKLDKQSADFIALYERLIKDQIR